MQTEKIPIDYWLSVHEKVRKDIRRYVVILLTVTAVAFIQGWNRLQDMNLGYDVAREFTLSLEKNQPSLTEKETTSLFDYWCKENAADCIDGHISVRLESIPRIGWEYEQYLNKNKPLAYFKVGGYELGLASFGLFMLLAPSILLFLIFLKTLTLNKISKLISKEAVDYGELQQCLNSVFNERATQKLGEHRWYYTSFWVIALLLMSLAAPTMYESMNLYRKTNTVVDVDKAGYIQELPDAPLSTKTIQLTLDDRAYFDYIILRDIGTLVIGILLWITLVQQLKPHQKSLVRTNEETD
jgi:hypothetical protein